MRMIQMAAMPLCGITLGLSISALPALAQPSPSFRASCKELRGVISDAHFDPKESHTIEIEDLVYDVVSDDALDYIFICRAPDPEVWCLTNEGKNVTIGERSVIGGVFIQIDDNHIVLDPCLAGQSKPQSTLMK